MPTISPDAKIITQINVFTVAPENQAKLIEILTETVRTLVRGMPGFVSANIHASRDGSRVANYAQWASPDAFAAMMKHPGMRASLEACLAIAEPSSAIYDVRAVIEGPG